MKIPASDGISSCQSAIAPDRHAIAVIYADLIAVAGRCASRGTVAGSAIRCRKRFTAYSRMPRHFGRLTEKEAGCNCSTFAGILGQRGRLRPFQRSHVRINYGKSFSEGKVHVNVIDNLRDNSGRLR